MIVFVCDVAQKNEPASLRLGPFQCVWQTLYKIQFQARFEKCEAKEPTCLLPSSRLKKK